MGRLKIPPQPFYLRHLSKFSQYSQSKSWMTWYADVAKFKGLRTLRILKKYKKSNARLLDLGCGIGLTLSIVAQEFRKSIGCDIDEKAFEATRIILKKVGVKIPLIVYGGETLPFKDNSFDIVTSIEVIEHVKEPGLMLREIKRVLKPDGILHITTANKWWPYEPHFKLPFLSYLPPKLADIYVKFTGKGENYQGIKLPSYREFKEMVDQYFVIEDITLSTIENYRKYFLDKERGVKVVILGKFLDWLRLKNLDAIPLSKIVIFSIKWLFLRFSLGWLFIARPRK